MITTTIFAHWPYVSLGLRSADDLIIDDWWRHNDQTIVTLAREKIYLTR